MDVIVDKINDEYIIKLFFGVRQIKRKIYTKYKDPLINDDIKIYLNNRFSDSFSLKETLFRIKYNIQTHPKCPICGNYLPFKGKNSNNGEDVFYKHCSKKCTQSDINVRQKRYNTSVEKYGYGCNIKKMKTTCITKYGVDNVYKADFIKKKIKETCLQRYGVDNYFKTKEFIYNSHTPEANNKRVETKKKNHTFNTSKPEEECYILLKENYEEVIRQYKSDKYPFACDFYIPEIDTYIEYNGLWTHGGKPYEGTEEDEQQLNEWKIKSENSKFYRNAIHNWTKTDVNKRKIAKENNLNYIEFWNLKEVEYWLKNKER